MSATSVRIFGCPTCGFRVDTNEQSCPRCGNEFRDDTRFECPFCGDLVHSGLDKCPSCHVSYSEFKARAAPKAADDSIDSLLMEIIKLEATSVKDEEKRFSCPKCDLLLEGTETHCPRCGKSLDVEIALQCPVCGALVGARDHRCGECGTVFDADAESASRTEDAESKLEEIMSFTGPSEPEQPEMRTLPSPAPVQARERNSVIDFASSMLGKPKDVVRTEPEKSRPPPPPPEPPAVEQPEPEPTAEPPQTAPPIEPEKTPQELFEEIEAELADTGEGAPAPTPKKSSSGTGKKKTRKLKAKPKQ